SQHDLLAERARERRRAEVDRLAVRKERELAVLRHAALRDVHAREHLHARHDLGRDVEWNALLFDHLAVDAEAHVEAIAFRLEVNVASLRTHRTTDDLVEDDDRALLEDVGHEKEGSVRKYGWQLVFAILVACDDSTSADPVPGPVPPAAAPKIEHV